MKNIEIIKFTEVYLLEITDSTQTCLKTAEKIATIEGLNNMMNGPLIFLISESIK